MLKNNDNNNLKVIKEKAFEFADNKFYEKGIECAKEALNITPLDAELHAVIAYCYLGLRKFKLAKKHLNNSFEIDPDSTNACLVETEFLIQEKKYNDAEIKLLSLCQSTRSERCYIQLIKFYMSYYQNENSWHQKESSLILTKFEETLHKFAILFQKPYTAELIKLEFYAGIQKFELAHRGAERCIGIVPDDSYPYFVKSYIYIQEKKLELAMEFVQEGLRFSPNDSWGLDILAFLKIRLRKKFVAWRPYIYYSGVVILIGGLVIFKAGALATLGLIKLLFIGVSYIEACKFRRYRKSLSKIKLSSKF